MQSVTAKTVAAASGTTGRRPVAAAAAAPLRSPIGSRQLAAARLARQAAPSSSPAAAGWRRRRAVARPVLASVLPPDHDKEKFTALNKDYAVVTQQIEVRRAGVRCRRGRARCCLAQHARMHVAHAC